MVRPSKIITLACLLALSHVSAKREKDEFKETNEFTETRENGSIFYSRVEQEMAADMQRVINASHSSFFNSHSSATRKQHPTATRKQHVGEKSTAAPAVVTPVKGKAVVGAGASAKPIAAMPAVGTGVPEKAAEVVKPAIKTKSPTGKVAPAVAAEVSAKGAGEPVQSGGTPAVASLAAKPGKVGEESISAVTGPLPAKPVEAAVSSVADTGPPPAKAVEAAESSVADAVPPTFSLSLPPLGSVAEPLDAVEAAVKAVAKAVREDQYIRDQYMHARDQYMQLQKHLQKPLPVQTSMISDSVSEHLPDALQIASAGLRAVAAIGGSTVGSTGGSTPEGSSASTSAVVTASVSPEKSAKAAVPAITEAAPKTSIAVPVVGIAESAKAAGEAASAPLVVPSIKVGGDITQSASSLSWCAQASRGNSHISPPQEVLQPAEVRKVPYQWQVKSSWSRAGANGKKWKYVYTVTPQHGMKPYAKTIICTAYEEALIALNDRSPEEAVPAKTTPSGAAIPAASTPKAETIAAVPTKATALAAVAAPSHPSKALNAALVPEQPLEAGLAALAGAVRAEQHTKDQKALKPVPAKV